jgi:hypothetical protein
MRISKLNRTKLLWITLVFSLFGFHAMADDLIFICHKGFKNSRTEVSRSYRAQFDVPHVTDNLSLKSKMLKVLGMSEEQYSRMWNRFYFRRALNLPVRKKNDAEVIDYVASTPDSIGYISSAPDNPDVEVCGKD